jgi:DNA modification methylase
MGKIFTYEKTQMPETAETFNYSKRPVLEEIPVKKRAVKRHFGVHGYFTRQAWNVVSTYIKNYTREGDLVLDPFGGSGVTAIEALVNDRKAINVDLNPMAVFIVQALLAPVNTNELSAHYGAVRDEYRKKQPKTKADIEKILEEYPGPKNLVLPKGSDVETVLELFSHKQLAQLALLKGIIKKEKNEKLRDTLLLMFSGLLTKKNLTYHTSTIATKDGQGDASAMRYYRYRIAPNPIDVDTEKYFELRYKKILAAKKEIEELCILNQKTVEQIVTDAQIIKGTATDLSFIPKESVDYIYTDPPYGNKIPYLDLSAMWNAWLDFDVTEEDYQMEAIEGGEHHKTKDDYNNLIAKSIEEMYRVLKYDRWLSFVFAHKDPEFWHLIIETCEKCGFEYIGAMPQKNGQTSFKKRQHPFTVLSGQLIINFRKVHNPRAVLKANIGMDMGEAVIQTIEGIIARDNGATLEQINDELIIKGLELGFLDLLKKEYSDITPLLMEKFDYDSVTEKYTIKKDTKFQTQIDIRLRIRFYLISYLRRMEREHKIPTFNEIVFAILPLLKNGITPEHQTVLSVLEDIGERIGEDGWRIKPKESTLFDGM